MCQRNTQIHKEEVNNVNNMCYKHKIKSNEAIKGNELDLYIVTNILGTSF